MLFEMDLTCFPSLTTLLCPRASFAPRTNRVLTKLHNLARFARRYLTPLPSCRLQKLSVCCGAKHCNHGAKPSLNYFDQYEFLFSRVNFGGTVCLLEQQLRARLYFTVKRQTVHPA